MIITDCIGIEVLSCDVVNPQGACTEYYQPDYIAPLPVGLDDLGDSKVVGIQCSDINSSDCAVGKICYVITTTTTLESTTTTVESTTTTTSVTTTTTSGGDEDSGINGCCGGNGPLREARAPTCFDGLRNQGEEGVDCGGPCEPCESCDDGLQNQGESGIDCGGPCAPCPVRPTCDDGLQNQGETEVDCGGPCRPCRTLPTTTVATTTQATTTTAPEVAPPKFDYCTYDLSHCTDKIKNCNETALDCGGECDPCSTPGILGRVVQFVGQGWLTTSLLVFIILSYMSYRLGILLSKRKEEEAAKQAKAKKVK